MPAGSCTYYGWFEGGDFKGAVIFAQQTQRYMGRAYGLSLDECAELVRVALGDHEAPTSKVVMSAVRQYKKSNPGVRLLYSYADAKQGHLGIIYQATNWVYVGDTGNKGRFEFYLDGKQLHNRTCNDLYGTSSAAKLREIEPRIIAIPEIPKHKYLMPLTKGMKAVVQKGSLPYPRRAENVLD